MSAQIDDDERRGNKGLTTHLYQDHHHCSIAICQGCVSVPSLGQHSKRGDKGKSQCDYFELT